MKISNAQRDEQGEWKFDLGLSQEETSFLVELSISSLLKVGLLKVEEQDGEQSFDLASLITEVETVQ